MAINATSEQQRALLDLQALDTTLLQLNHKRDTVPEIAIAHELEIELGQVEYRLIAVKTEISDVSLEQKKAEADVEQVVAREVRDQQRLDTGGIPAKDLTNIQHELGSLAKRRAELEDVELEIMQRLEDAQLVLKDLTAQLEEVKSRRDDVVGARDEALRMLDAQIAEVTTDRAAQKVSVPAELLALYDKIREDQGGIGAAMLHRGACQGCHITLNSADLDRIRKVAEDTVIRCEECRRILVRTAESGL